MLWLFFFYITAFFIMNAMIGKRVQSWFHTPD